MFWMLLVAPSLAQECTTPGELRALLEGPCPTLALMGAEHAAREAGTLSCLSRSREGVGLGPIATTSPSLPPPPPGAEKALRDWYDMPLAHESENFVLRWGNSKSMSTERIEQILASFESAWELVLEDRSYVPPAGTDTYKFNIYISDSGGPPSGGAAYYTRDPNGHPMISITQGTYNDVSFGWTVGAHEFYHALQDASGAPYAYGDFQPGAWYWEATANWIETEIYPENEAQTLAYFLQTFMLYPHLSVNFFDYPDGSAGAVESYQYGAFIFPYFLSREVADADLIRESWLEPVSDNPLDTLDAVLQAEWETDIVSAFFDFAAYNATYERYDDRDTFTSALRGLGEYGNDRVVDTVAGNTNGWMSADEALWPSAFGSNYIKISPRRPDIRVLFQGDTEGSLGRTPTWDARLVIVDADGERDEPLLLDEGTGEVFLEGVDNVDEMWLVISVVSDRIDWRESFGYQYAVEAEGELIDEPEPELEDTGNPLGQDTCGCTAGAGGAGLWLAVVGLFSVLARRKRGAA